MRRTLNGPAGRVKAPPIGRRALDGGPGRALHPAVMPEPIAYKIMTEAEHEIMRRGGVFHGSVADLADGFIHLSTASQLPGTLDKHYAGRTRLVVVAVDLRQLGDAVRWEPSRGGELFPHIHGTLPLGAVLAAEALARQPDGALVLPGAGVSHA